MSYRVKYQRQAIEDAARLQKDEPQAFKKLLKLEAELKEHPRTGTGHPEQLHGDRSNQWSRHITKKHRLIYEIYDTEVVVLVLTAYGHYGDK
ncbi:MAG: Txe/YoeB family addiction module toxin [Bacteroidales bacterium]|nr:Txe/YoeB family addiction module toxin [Bacteroidales bacterium]